MTRYMLLDVNNLAYPILHTLGPLSYNGQGTNILFGLMKSIRLLQDTLLAEPIFCFDAWPEYRKSLYPGYKSARADARKDDPVEMQEARKELREQVDRFRTELLPAIGATNIIHLPKYEADDGIAASVAALPDAKKIYIVSTDQDLWQLLRGTQVVVYNNITKSYFSEADFMKKFDGLQPCMFASLKAWTGCTSDSIEGVAKVGPKTATKWLLGKIPGNPLFEDNISVYSRNIELTRLPAKGCPEVTILPQGELDWGILERAIGATSKQNPIPAGVKKR